MVSAKTLYWTEIATEDGNSVSVRIEVPPDDGALIVVSVGERTPVCLTSRQARSLASKLQRLATLLESI